MACTRATDVVVLHAGEIDVDAGGVRIADGAGKPVRLMGVSFMPAWDFMTVVSYGGFGAGREYVLTVPFAGNITEGLVGYYRSSYADRATGRTRYV